MRWLGKGRIRLFREQTGFSLIETLVAVLILGFIGGGVILAIDTNYRATGVLDEQVVATNLATAHFEVIRELPYDKIYPEYSNAGDNITIPFQYSVVIDADYSNDGTTWAEDYDPGSVPAQTLQRITLSVFREGGQAVLSICTYRTDR